MIASVKCTQPKPAWHPRFLDMLPAIRTRAGFAFRDLDVEARDEAMQQVIVSTFIAFGQLVRQHRAHLASPSALARFAVAQIRIGRCLDTKLNSHDVLSRYAQHKRGFRVQRLLEAASDHAWREVLVEDRRATPAEVALTRLDFEEWLGTLSPRQRMMANALAEGHTVTDIAAQIQVSVGRVSQIRRAIGESWDAFHREGN